MNKFLLMFCYIWAGIVVILNLLGIAGMALTTNTLEEFIKWLQETYSPFNLWNWGLNLLLLSPALGAYIWKEKRKRIGE